MTDPKKHGRGIKFSEGNAHGAIRLDPETALKVRELLRFRDRALGGAVESVRPTRLKLDIESSSLRDSCLSSMAGILSVSVPELLEGYLLQGFETDLMALELAFCSDAFQSHGGEEQEAWELLPLWPDLYDFYSRLNEGAPAGILNALLLEAGRRRSALGNLKERLRHRAPG